MRIVLSKLILVGSVLVVSMLGWISVVQAASITFSFVGTVTQIQAFNPSMVPLPAAINDTVTGFYTFESTAGSPCGVNGPCVYTDGITDLRFTVGSYTNTGLGVPLNFMFVQNGSIVAPNSFDRYITAARFSGPSLGGGIDARDFTLEVQDPSGNMFANTNLPSSAPPLTANSSWSISWNNPLEGGSVQLRGAVTSLSEVAPVPLPSTRLLFGLGMVGLAVWRWRTV